MVPLIVGSARRRVFISNDFTSAKSSFKKARHHQEQAYLDMSFIYIGRLHPSSLSQRSRC